MKGLLGFFLLISALALQARDVIDDTGLCRINWSEGYITCVGESAQGQSSFAAKLSAKVIAQRNLLEVVKGVRIDSEVSVSDGMIASDVIKSRVEGVIRGVQILSNLYDSQKQSAAAMVRLRMGKDLLGALLSDPTQLSWNEKIERFWRGISLVPSAEAAVYSTTERKTIEKILKELRTQGDASGAAYLESVLGEMDANRYTGILIDVSEISDFQKAMIVRLVDEGGSEVYPDPIVSRATLMKRNTSVGFKFGYEDAKQDKRVFDKPLEFKAASVYKNKKSNIVLSPSQLELLRSVDPTVLRQAKIILVLGD